MFFLHDFSEAVWAVVCEVKKKWFLMILLEKFHGMVRDGFGGVLWFLVNFALPNHVIVIKGRRMPARLGKPISEPFLRMQIITQMPFATEPAGIPGFRQDLRQRAKFLYRRVSFRSNLCFVRDVGVNAMLRWN